MEFNGRYILDENGDPQPCEDLLTWARWFETHTEQRRLAVEHIGPYMISTVFLGLDHSWRPIEDPLTYKPVLWETMIFKKGDVANEAVFMRRYASREDAFRGHLEACILAKRKYQFGDDYSEEDLAEEKRHRDAPGYVCVKMTQ